MKGDEMTDNSTVEQDKRFEPTLLTPNVFAARKNRFSKSVSSEAPTTMVIVEQSAFMRDCLQRCLTDAWQGRTIGYSSISEYKEDLFGGESALVLLSTFSLNQEETARELEGMKGLGSGVQTMVLAKDDDLNCALCALSHGAKGYISMSAGFDILFQALCFVAAGGTYVPAQCLLEAKMTPTTPIERAPANLLTTREMAVVEAIRCGKPNKAIAYELNMCESTVKVHVRHIMKKLNARNRTEVAMKAAKLA
jgi:DNA-binding NarL/FixJ family response regulator